MLANFLYRLSQVVPTEDLACSGLLTSSPGIRPEPLVDLSVPALQTTGLFNSSNPLDATHHQNNGISNQPETAPITLDIPPLYPEPPTVHFHPHQSLENAVPVGPIQLTENTKSPPEFIRPEPVLPTENGAAFNGLNRLEPVNPTESVGNTGGFTRPEPVQVAPVVDAALPTNNRPGPILIPPVDPTPVPTSPVFSAGGATISNLIFSGLEGDSGTFQIRLSQAPTAAVTLTFNTGDFLVIDADNTLSNGTQISLTFTADNWNQDRTIWFLAEKDGVSTNRVSGNTIAYTLTGGTTDSGTYNLGTITNTYAPDPARFNITLDFRNDNQGYWTTERQAIAQKAADDWASKIANEWTDLQLNNAIQMFGDDGSYTEQTFNTKAFVDDLLIFLSPLSSDSAAGGYGSPVYELGGWFGSPDIKPRVGQVSIDVGIDNLNLYNVVAHEIGHVLGLVGYNWEGYLQQDLSTPQTAVFKGSYAQAANGGNYIPLQSQDGPNPITGAYDYWHPADSVVSIMSYNWLYSVSGPTAIDFAMLADSGYQVYGVNATPTTSTVTTTTSTATTANASETVNTTATNPSAPSDLTTTTLATVV